VHAPARHTLLAWPRPTLSPHAACLYRNGARPSSPISVHLPYYCQSSKELLLITSRSILRLIANAYPFSCGHLNKPTALPSVPVSTHAPHQALPLPVPLPLPPDPATLVPNRWEPRFPTLPLLVTASKDTTHLPLVIPRPPPTHYSSVSGPRGVRTHHSTRCRQMIARCLSN
jgi:hypothetical protein